MPLAHVNINMIVLTYWFSIFVIAESADVVYLVVASIKVESRKHN